MRDHEQWDIESGVGKTALAIAAGRAIETHRPDGLVVDPFAASFVKAVQTQVPLPTRLEDLSDESAEDSTWPAMATYIGLRARYYDAYLARAGATGVDQVVVLGAGLDARPFRLEWPPGSTVFELDQPKVLEFKDKVLAEADARARCGRVVVPVDLREDWPAALRDVGFDANRSTAWLAEGLIFYVPAGADRTLLGRVHELSAPGSWVGFDYPGKFASSQLREQAQSAGNQTGIDVSGLLHIDSKTDPEQFFSDHGWSVRVETAADVAASYQRSLDGSMGEASGQFVLLTGHR